MGKRHKLTEILGLMAPLADALEYAHRQGIVHRDIKPANVLLESDGRPKLTDFGLARMLEGSAGLTRSNTILGTPEYMSPEQALAQPADARSDLYALGIIIYQMLLGQTPFHGDTPLETLMAHIHHPVPLPSSVDPEIDPRLDANLIRALAKDPADRHKSPTELIQVLSSISAETKPDIKMESDAQDTAQAQVGSSSVTQVEALESDLGKGDSAIEVEPLLHEPVESRRFRLPPIVIGAGVATSILVAGVFAYIALQPDRGPEGAGEPEPLGLVSSEPTPLATPLEESVVAATAAPRAEPTKASVAAPPTAHVDSPSDDPVEPDVPTPAPTISSGTTGLIRAGAISGRATDAVTGQPIADVSIQAQHLDGNSSYGEETDSDGQYTMTGVVPGTYWLSAVADRGYFRMLYDNQPNDDAADAVSVEPGARVGEIDFALNIGGTISGRVTDTKTGLPVSGVSIELDNFKGGYSSSRTDSNGRYVIVGVAPGSHQLSAHVSPLGYVDEGYPDVLTFLGEEEVAGKGGTLKKCVNSQAVYPLSETTRAQGPREEIHRLWEREALGAGRSQGRSGTSWRTGFEVRSRS